MNEELHHQLSRAVGGFNTDVPVEAMSQQDMGAIMDARVVQDDGEGQEDSALLEALTGAVQQPEEWQPAEEGGPEANTTPTTATSGLPLSTTPPTGLSLNAGVDGDEQLTAWLQSRLNS